ncbi:DNA polymerase I, partial [Patescibacteria group bacterium]|nr:DNA polymerase I [Patescibacteria group bacterium]
MPTPAPHEKQLLLAIDGNAILHRAWHALPPLTDRHGRVVNAVYGFLTLLFRAVKDLSPTHLIVTFDRPGKTFRHDTYAEYKATRIKQPDELYAQIPILEEVLRAFAIPVFAVDGFEADDVLGTISSLATKTPDLHTYILTGDLDTLQLISQKTSIVTLRKGLSDIMIYDDKAVVERFGLSAKQMIDYKALRGDPSDNIKGVPGVGEKTATELLKEFGTLEELYGALQRGNTGKIKPGVIEKLRAHEQDALTAKMLVTIKRDLPLDFSLRRAAIVKVPREKIVELFGDLEFRSLMNRVPEGLIEHAALAEEPAEETSTPKKKTGKKPVADAPWIITDAVEGAKWTTSFLAATKKSAGAITILVSAEPLVALRTAETVIVFHGVFAVRTLKPLLEDEAVKKITHDVKNAEKILLTHGSGLTGVIFDTVLADYLIAPGIRGHDLTTLALTHLKKELPIAAGGQGSLLAADTAALAADAATMVRAVHDIAALLQKEIDERNQTHLLVEMEIPLAHVLAEMERSGISVDVEFLQRMSTDFGKRIDRLTKEIWKDAGSEFNIASPQQLKVVLFETLRIPTDHIKKTATGSGLSTAASELEKLRSLHPIIEKIFVYRELTKLKSTYIDALPALVDTRTGRVHTTYSQVTAATGRLSSNDPNLQNIPIRTELGREIRRAFVAERGRIFVAADYSQIELRLVAAIANAPFMIAAFKNNEDIHRRTAATIWDVPLDQVTSDQRRAAKAINFGIIYGMGPQGLSQGAGISFTEAKLFIQKYFDANPEVRAYMDTLKILAHKQGYVETVFGRRRYLPEIDSGMAQLRAGAERMAINHPIQGTAADLIKLSMIHVHTELKKKIPEARLILTVHDELVVE